MVTITPAFLAMQGDDDEWIETGFLDLASIPDAMITELGGYLDGQSVPAPTVNFPNATRSPAGTDLQKKHFAPIRLYRCKAERPYTPTGSSVGPYVSGRVGFSEFYIERNSDKLSPIIMEYCCMARQFSIIHLAYWLNEPRLTTAPDQLVHIEIGGANISDYQIQGDLVAGQRFTPQPLNLQTATSLNQVGFVSGARRIEQFSLWFTTIRIRFLGVERYWDAGSDSPYEAP